MRQNYQFQLNLFKKQRDYIIFSLPQTNHYQTISQLDIKPKPKVVIKENKHRNEIIISGNGFKMNFLSQPLEINRHIFKEYGVGDYDTKKPSPNRFINGSDIKIKGLKKKVVGNSKVLNDVVKKLYYFTLDYLTYGKPIDGLYPYTQALEERVTDCGGFSTFLASLLQSQGILTRLVIGFLIKESLLTKLLFNSEFCILNFKFLLIHAWLELQLPDGLWFPLDPSIEWCRSRGLTKRLGGFGYIPADRLVVSFGEDFKIQIKNKIYQVDILQKPIYV